LNNQQIPLGCGVPEDWPIINEINEI
ncbi:MAG: hypothetical protein HW380_3630, partial [Magnetococcales bacterium]|nr:hypothetical protein [Magnetococcales bacterium]